MRVFLTGGGTAGSVIPLLAVAEHIPHAELHFVGTKLGVERSLVDTKLYHYHIISSGKLRRYIDWRNLIDPWRILIGFFQAIYLLLRYKPDVVISAGSFVSVPIIWAAWLCGVPRVIHQQDIQIGLATKLMKPFATIITKAFQDIPLAAEWIGNPVRDLQPTTQQFVLADDLPVVLITGGGTGAEVINTLITPELCKRAYIIHITGKGKAGAGFNHPHYQAFELLTEAMKEALSKSTIVVSRAGLSTLTELMSLGKPSIIIPMPHTHQEYNAQWLQKNNAAVVLNQLQLDPQQFTEAIMHLLENTKLQATLATNIQTLHKPNAAQELAKILTNISTHV